MVTLRDIAKESGYSKTAVWLALKESSRIPPATRERIRGIADRLGYAPNAAYKQMLSQVRSGQSVSYRSTLALVHGFDIPDPEKRNPYHRSLVEGAMDRAKALGYSVESFWAKQPNMRGKRLSDILESRGIKGVLITPMPRHSVIDLDWDRFAAVKVGHTLIRPRLNIVEANNQQAMSLCLKELDELGYRKIGLVMKPDHELYRRYQLTVPYLWMQSQLEPEQRAEPLLLDPGDPSSFLEWFEKYRFEAVVTTHTHVVDWLKQCGYRIPEDVGIVFPTPVHEYNDFSHVNQKPYQIGMAVVDMIDAQLNRGEYGCPANPKVAYTDVDWFSGISLREMIPSREQAIQHSVFFDDENPMEDK